MGRKEELSRQAIRLQAEFNKIKVLRGDLADLSTGNKASLVDAINEIDFVLSEIDLTDLISDSLDASGAKVWSIDKIKTEMARLKDGILGGVGSAADTLAELLDAIEKNGGDLFTVLNAQALRVRVDAPQAFDEAQKTQGRANMGAASADGVGDTGFDFVALFEAGLN